MKNSNISLVYNELFDKTREISGIGFWYVDLVKKETFWDAQTKLIHEVPSDYQPTLEGGVEFYKEGASRDKIAQLVGVLIEEGTAFDTELQIVTKNKKDLWVRAVGQAHYIDGALVGLYGTFQDIDEKKNELNEVNVLKERLRLATSAAELGVWDWDVKNNILVWDDMMYKIYGVDKKDFGGAYEAWRNGLHPDDVESGDIAVDLALKGEKDFNIEFRVIRADKSVRIIGAKGNVFRDHEGNPIRMIGANWDLTEAVESKEKLQVFANRMAMAQNIAKYGVWEWDIISDKLVWDKHQFEIYDATDEDKAKNDPRTFWGELIHPEDAEQAAADTEAAVKGERDFDTQFRIITKKGKLKYIRAVGTVTRNEKGEPTFFMGINWDVTKDMQVQSLLEENARKMDLAQSVAKFGVWELNIQTEKLTWNQGMYTLYGAPDDFNREVNPKSFWEKCVDENQRKIATEQTMNAITKFEPIDSLLEIVTPNGEKKFIKGTGRAFPGADGKPESVIGINWDFTKDVLRSRELESQNKKLTELSEKLKKSNESLEEFAYIASHDLKTPIRNMATFAQFLKEDYSDALDEEGLEMLSGIKMQAQRMTDLVDDLLTYSRVNKMKLEKKEVNINSLVQSTRELLGIEVAGEVEIDVQDLGSLKVDPVRMREVFNNLITNAIKYNTSSVKKVNIWREGNVFYVKDNGIGIDERFKKKVFAFFKRLHAKDEFGGGTGAGMAIVKKVIDQHNGTIDFISKEGEGTTFVLDFG